MALRMVIRDFLEPDLQEPLFKAQILSSHDVINKAAAGDGFGG
jgi:hypothetical protein